MNFSKTPASSAALVLATLLGLSGPAAAAVTSISVQMTTPTGPISACPPELIFAAKINYAVEPNSNHQIQYKWIDSSGNAYETVTGTLPVANNSTNLFAAATKSFSWHGEGTYWVALETIYPNNVTSNKVTFKLTCPSTGSLSLQ